MLRQDYVSPLFHAGYIGLLLIAADAIIAGAVFFITVSRCCHSLFSPLPYFVSMMLLLLLISCCFCHYAIFRHCLLPCLFYAAAFSLRFIY